jgi:PAS domain S-box-containing protein
MPTLEHYQAKATTAFGDARDPIASVAKRAEQVFDRSVIVWEGDAQTFQFSFVSEGAERLLGHPSERWIREATFWADSVVHPDDRDEAVAYCALATARCRDHAFVYRATALDGRVLWLADYVQVVLGTRRIAERLRGIMIDVTDIHAESSSEVGRWVSPPREQLGEAR